MTYLSPDISGETPVCTEWTVVDTSTGDNDDVAPAKAGETGKHHYITFIAVSCDNTSSGNTVIATLADGPTTYLVLWPIHYNTNQIYNFTFPIKMAVAKTATLTVAMGGTDDVVSATIGGFTR